MACPAISDDSFLSSALGYVDCQAMAIGQQGFLTLSTPGSAIQIALGGALTLYIALFGYRLLFGETPSVRDVVAAVIKLGVVLTLATSWPAFRTLAYDVALRGPTELAIDLAVPSGLPPGQRLVGQLQALDDQIVELAMLGVGRHPDANALPNQAAQPARLSGNVQASAPAQSDQVRWDPASDASSLASARIIFLASTIAAFAAARLVAGLVLALGPLFALLLLFDGTRAFLEGWIRALAGAALGSLMVAILLAVEAALIGPWLNSVLDLRNQGIWTPAVPIELLTLTLVFGLILLAGLIAAARIAQAFRFLPIAERVRAGIQQAIADPGRHPALTSARGRSPFAGRSRASTIADAIAATKRREAIGDHRDVAAHDRPAPATGSRDGAATLIPLGQGFRSRTRGRVSAGKKRRDIAK